MLTPLLLGLCVWGVVPLTLLKLFWRALGCYLIKVLLNWLLVFMLVSLDVTLMLSSSGLVGLNMDKGFF